MTSSHQRILLSKDFVREKIRSIETLLDYREIARSMDKGFIDQAIFYIFNELESKQKQYSDSNLSNVFDVLKMNFENTFFDYSVQNKPLNQLSFNYLSNVELYSWEKAQELLEDISLFISYFSPEGALTTELSKNSLKITIKTSPEKISTSFREQVYSYFKSMLSKNILLTFRLRNNNRIEFFWDFEPSGSCMAKFDLEKDSGYLIDSYFFKYSCTEERFRKFGKHNIIFFNKNGKIEKLEQSPHKFKNDLTNYNFYHFSFLFRPLSLILPNEFSLIEQQGSLFKSKSIEARNALQNTQKANQSLFIDLFDFFSL